MNLTARRALWPAYRELLKRSDRPILVGPWRGEVGFEVLYWLPWLMKLRKELGIAPERLFPIGRGGSAGWYHTPQGFELLAMRDAKAVRVENREQHMRTGKLKQEMLTPFDRAVLNDCADTLKISKYLTLHPAWMYAALESFWDGRTGLASLQEQCEFVPIATPPLPDGVTLPEKFVAVRFYTRYTFPPREDLTRFAKEVITQLASQQPVILLQSQTHLDDHWDLQFKAIPNVSRLSDYVPLNPETNLLVTSAVLARSLGFVGTYGGFAQLALRLGRPSVSFYHQWGGTALAHKHLSDGLSTLSGIPFLVHRLQDLPLLQSVCPQMVPTENPHLDRAEPQPA